MVDIDFTAAEKAVIVGKIQRYFAEELQQGIGRSCLVSAPQRSERSSTAAASTR